MCVYTHVLLLLPATEWCSPPCFRGLLRESREIELCERRGRESSASLRDSDPLGAAASSSSSTAEPAPPTGRGRSHPAR